MYKSVFYDDVWPNGLGNEGRNKVELPAGRYRFTGDFSLNDRISAAKIHPTHTVDFYQDSEFRGRLNQVGHGVLTNQQMRNMNIHDNISSMVIHQNIDPNDWKRRCCRNEITEFTDSEKCGDLWSQSWSQCGDLGCTGDGLLHDSICKTWCKKNPSACDGVKMQFCTQFPDHGACACIQDRGIDRLTRDRYKAIPAGRQCFPNSPCQGTDLLNTLRTTDLNLDVCPENIHTQIMEIDNRGGTIKDSIITQDMQSNSGASQNQYTSDTVFWIFVLIFVVISIVGGVTAYYFWPNENPNL
jgi:hypothetical protein